LSRFPRVGNPGLELANAFGVEFHQTFRQNRSAHPFGNLLTKTGMQSTSTIIEGFRLSPQQRRLWKLQEEDSARSRSAEARGGARSFRSQLVLSLDGRLRAETLREALGKVCERHEALRMTFRRLPGVVMPVQSVADRMLPSWRTIDLSDLAGTAQADEVEALLALESTFDYEHGPMVQATLVILSNERCLLSVNLPALCGDRRTLSNFATELGRGYAALIDGRGLDDEPLQYVQFSEWQNSLSEEEDAVKAEEYWSKLDLSTAFAALPGENAREVVRAETRREASATVLLASLPGQSAREVVRAATRREASATVLLAAWQTLLWRRSQEPVVIGNVRDCRSYELLQDAFGLFARVLPVCGSFTEGMRFDEVVAEIDRFQRESEEWQDHFQWDHSAPQRYFRFGFEFAEPISCFDGGHDLRVSVVRARCDFEPFELKLTCVANEGGGIELEFEYDDALFDRAYVSHLAEQFETLLDAAVANPESRVEELEIVSAAERRRVVVEWNDTARNYELDECVHRLFERQVERTPDAVAVVFQDQRLTFAELNARAEAVAGYLQEQGVGIETPVGVCFEPSIEMVVAVLGVLKAGGAYVPLDPRNPRQRIEQVMNDAGATVLLTGERIASVTPSGKNYGDEKKSEIDADNVAYIIYTSGSTGQPKGVMVQHRSVVNLANALRDEVYAGLDANESSRQLKVGLSAPLAFDASVKQLLQLLFGHTLFILPEELRLDAAHALDYFEQHELDAVDCTPSQLKLLLAAGFEKRATKPKLLLVGGEAIDKTTWLRLAGDSLRAADTQTRFFNVYGPTECTVDATWTPVTATANPSIGRPIPNAEAYILDKNLNPAGIHLDGELLIGGAGLARGYLNSPDRTAERFIPDALSGKAGARLYRTGDLAHYSPDGQIIFTGRNDAQVKIRGHRIELGEIESALRQHDQVRDAVVVARESTNADVRLVAYVLPAAGNVIYSESQPQNSRRNTTEITRRSSTDQENAIDSEGPQSSRRNATEVTRRSSTGQENAIDSEGPQSSRRNAIEVTRRSSTDQENAIDSEGPQSSRRSATEITRRSSTGQENVIDIAELRRSLSERLPDYMTPSFIVALDEFPLTRNGKVDLNALPAPEAVRTTPAEHYVAPRNEVEATITRVWQEVLGIERIGVNDNFFDAGGHSLLMVQVHNKLSELFEKKISIVEMFAKPTIGALAEYFSETNGHKPTFEKVMDRAARRRHAASVRQ